MLLGDVVHVHDRVAFAIDLLIFLLTGTAAGAPAAAATVTAFSLETNGCNCRNFGNLFVFKVFVISTPLGSCHRYWRWNWCICWRWQWNLNVCAVHNYIIALRTGVCSQTHGSIPKQRTASNLHFGKWLHGATCSFLSFHCLPHLCSERDVVGKNFSNTCPAASAVCQVGSGVITFLHGLALSASWHPSACLCQVRFGDNVRPGYVDILFFSWRWLLNPWNFLLRQLLIR